MIKQVRWVGSSREDLSAFPEEVRQEAGYSIYLAQRGELAPHAVPMVGFGGANVIEVVMNHDGNAYRAVYTVRFAEAVYVLHAFQKKSHKGRSTPVRHLSLIKHRLKAAEQDYQTLYGSETREKRR